MHFACASMMLMIFLFNKQMIVSYVAHVLGIFIWPKISRNNLPPFGKVTRAFTVIKQGCIPVGCVPPAHWPYCLVLCLPGGGGDRGVVVIRSDHVGGGGDRSDWGVTSSHDHVTYSMMHLMSHPLCDRMADACENITFSRFAMQAVKIVGCLHCFALQVITVNTFVSSLPMTFKIILCFVSASVNKVIKNPLRCIFYNMKQRGDSIFPSKEGMCSACLSVWLVLMCSVIFV